jgi:hypothetical protein
MRLQHSAGHMTAGLFGGRSLRRSFSAQTDCSHAEDAGRSWDPVKALGGLGLIAILAASAWAEWQLAKWVYYSLFA